jgi:hypothetical protein
VLEEQHPGRVRLDRMNWLDPSLGYPGCSDEVVVDSVTFKAFFLVAGGLQRDAQCPLIRSMSPPRNGRAQSHLGL